MDLWFVSRQRYLDGEHRRIVEIALGGRDYSNPDMLVPQFHDEGREYEDPREAVKAAISVCEQWRKARPADDPHVAHGATAGFTMYFEPPAVENFGPPQMVRERGVLKNNNPDSSLGIGDRCAWCKTKVTRKSGGAFFLDGDEPGATDNKTFCCAQHAEFYSITCWADERYEKMPKCPVCNELYGKERYRLEFSDEEFCSERCAEKEEEAQAKLNQEEEDA